MVAIDTNVLIRYYAKDSPVLEKQAHDILSQAKPRSLFLDPLVLAELAYVLKVFTASPNQILRKYLSHFWPTHVLFSVIGIWRVKRLRFLSRRSHCHLKIAGFWH
jgi:predicted nucleic acid-binding protein